MKLPTKADTIQQAKNAATFNQDVNTPNAFVLEKLTYDERVSRATALADVASASLAVNPKFADDYRAAYRDQAYNIWAGKVKQLDRARRNFKMLASSMSVDAATAKIKGLLNDMRIRGMRPMDDFSGLTVEVTRSLGVGATLYLRWERHDEPTENPDDESQKVYTHNLRTEVSWSSTTRTLSEARASVNLYNELLDAAAEVEALMQRERVVTTRGIPEPEPVKAIIADDFAPVTLSSLAGGQ